MARSASRPQRRQTARTAPSSCPCGRPEAYGKCCGRFHRGESAPPTAETLMRSRYSAFALGDEAYLLRTWHPRTRPPRVEFDPGTRWVRLEILGTGEGSAFHAAGTVTFRAGYTVGGRPGFLHECSRFERVDGEWAYVDGDFVE